MAEQEVELKVTIEVYLSEDDVKYTQSKRFPTPEELEEIKERLVSDLEYYVHESDMLITLIDDAQAGS